MRPADKQASDRPLRRPSSHPSTDDPRLSPLALQRTVGNRATTAVLQARRVSPIQRRAGLNPTWLADSRAGKDDRTGPLLTIDQRVNSYVNLFSVPWVDPQGAQDQIEMARSTARQSLSDILEAIDAWRETKLDWRGRVKSRRAAAVDLLEQDVRQELIAIGSQTDQQQATALNSWDPNSGAFTDPKTHDPNRYSFLVNALTPGGSPETAYRDLIQKNPDLVRNFPGIMSVSYITENIGSVWAPSGFILKVPKEDIIAASGRDMGVDNALLKRGMAGERDRLRRVKGIRTPTELTQDTPAGSHNEVAVRAAGVEVIGLFVIRDRKVDPLRRTPRPVHYGTKVRTRRGKDYVLNGRTIFEAKPGVSPDWMSNYKNLASERKIPLIWLTQPPGANIAMPVPEPGGRWPAAMTPQDVWLDDLTPAEQKRVELNRAR